MHQPMSLKVERHAIIGLREQAAPGRGFAGRGIS